MNENEMFARINGHADNAAWRREDRQARKAARRRRKALMIEACLFLLALALMALEAAGLVAGVVAYPVIGLSVCVMCFCGGFLIGRARER